MRLEDLDYDLPEAAIAQRPLADRAASRLLLLHRGSGRIEDRRFRDVPDLFENGDLLVLNDTRVTALRLLGEKPSGGRVEVLLLRPAGEFAFEALAKPGRRLRPGALIHFDQGLVATVQEDLPDGRKLLSFSPRSDLRERLEACGRVPLPPYIHEPLGDPDRYQTVYSRPDRLDLGSAAAPTAGLHFTPDILAALQAKGVGIAWVTLEVGVDTFRPISAEDPLQHPIHGERCHVPEATAQAVRAATGRIVAVGTTAVRTLETFAEAPRRLRTGTLESRLFITPGFEFRIVDGMFTNFHMPRTTMLLMLAAMAGRKAVMAAYAHALAAQYRFLSFGDSMLIL